MAEQDIPSVIKEAQKRFKLCQEAERERRTDALDDLKFRSGEQWPDVIKRQRHQDNRPCLTINRLPQFLRQVTNEQRQNRPSVHVNPVDDNGDPDTAEVIQGIIRHIEYDSHADIAWDTAFQFAAATGGPGWVRIITEVADEEKNQQDIKIKRVLNPFSVYIDPNCEEFDYSDADYAFVLSTLTEDEYKAEYPQSELASLDDWEEVGDHDPDWLTKDSVRIAEYFTRKNGKITWRKINALEVLDETEVPGKSIPLIPVFGDELYIDGKRIYEGVVRHAKDPQRMYNYWASAETEAIALAPRAPYIVAEGQLENHESEWQQANNRNFAYLTYKPTDVKGQPVGPPQRNVQEPAVAAITQARLASADDLKATTGIYDASLGARSNEQTGKAILARQQQGQIANFHYLDNLTRSVRRCGLIILGMIPKIYDKARVMRIIGEDGEQKTVKVNQPFAQGGVSKLYDLTTGKYDVTVTAGPSYTTKRQEAVESMLALIKAYPAMAPIVGDLVVKEMDWPGAKAVAERLKKMLPPQAQDDQDGDPAAKAQQMQAQLQALGQQHEMLVQQLNKAMEIIQQKQVEADAKITIAKLQEETKLAIAEITTKAQEVRARVEMEQGVWSDVHSASHEIAMQKDQQAHEQEMADRGAQFASAQSAQDAAQSAEQQQAAQPQQDEA